MTDTTTQKPIRVSTEDPIRPYLMVPNTQLGYIRELLEANHVRFWVDHNVISFNGKPAVVWINLARGTDPAQVQALLDTIA